MYFAAGEIFLARRYRQGKAVFVLDSAQRDNEVCDSGRTSSLNVTAALYVSFQFHVSALLSPVTYPQGLGGFLDHGTSVDALEKRNLSSCGQ
jgi:hypothetical protein